MKESRRKPFVIGITLFVLLAGTLVLWQNPQDSFPVSSAPSDEQRVTRAASDWVAEITACHLEEAVRLAKARGELMRELIHTNPKQAIRESLSLSEWSKLPPDIQAHVEQPFSAVANVDVMIACGEGFSETTIYTELPDSGNIKTFVYGHRKEIGSKTGIPVQGIRVGTVGAMREETFQPLGKSDELAALKLYPVATENPGGDAAAALAGGRLFYFKDQEALGKANERFARLEDLPGPNSGAQAFFQSLEAYLEEDGSIDFQALDELAIEMSTEWTGTPRDMYVIMIDFPDLTGQPADPGVFSNLLNTVISQQIGEMSYEKTHISATVNTNLYHLASPSTNFSNNVEPMHTEAVALVEADGVDLSPYDTVCLIFPKIPSLGNIAGIADNGGRRLWLNGTTNPDVVIHELGHNYGSSHASFWEVAGSDPVDPAGTRYEYGDFMDIMGGGDAPEGHFNALHKKRISWLDAENWQSVSNSGTYRIYRSDHYQTAGLLRGLEIEKGNPTNQYWVGLRQEYPNYETFSRGAYLLWKKPNDNRSYLLDTTPQSSGSLLDGGLALGQTYSDAAAEVHITPVDRGGQTPNEWMDITLNLGAFSGNSAPTASLSAPSNIAVQTSVLLSVTASDPDGDELAYFWDIGDGLVKPNAPSIPAAWLSAGTNTISCVVSDMKGGTNRVSQAIVISNAIVNWTKHTSGTPLNLEAIALGNGRLVVVCEDETTLYSDDATNWVSHKSFDITANNVFLKGVIYDGTKFIACGIDYDFGVGGWEQTIYTSTDGKSWTERYDSNAGGGYVRLMDVAYGGGYYVAVGENGIIVRSTDGLSWSTVTSGTSIDLQSVSYGENTFVVVGDESSGGSNPHVVLTSTNGLSWTGQSAGLQMPAGNWLFAVEYCKDRFLAGGWNSEIFGSIDQGLSFDYYLSGALDIAGFAYGNGNYFAAGRDLGNSSADINLFSVDGENWITTATPDQEDRNAAIFYNGTFITVGDNGSIWQSDSIGASDPGFAVWQLDNETALGLNRDPLDDADFDGHQNLYEYALGTSAFDGGAQPYYSFKAESGGYFQISYERDGIKADIDYSVERASNLVSNNWSSANTVTLEDSSTNLTVRSAFPIATQTNEFMRLNIDLK